MKFLREDKSAAEKAIAKKICEGLFKDKKVLWLVSGGSNIQIEKNVMDMIRNHAQDRLGGLAILPIDERYGAQGHEDSNTEMMRQAGFAPGNAVWIDVLMHGLPFDQTVEFYSEVAGTALANADVIVGQFGMGSDGHIAGIKPESPATTEPDESTIMGYNWEDYTRMTLMPAALKQITNAYLIAYGDDKKKPLLRLQKHDRSFQKLPAVLLYELPKVIVYNDQLKGGGTE